MKLLSNFIRATSSKGCSICSPRQIINIICLLLVLSAGSLYSQQTIAEADSVDTTVDSTFHMTKSPMGAVGRSALLPGWGQFYNESYWKIPIVWGFLGYFSYVWVKNNNEYHDYQDLYIDTGQANYKRLRDFYHNQRDQFAVYIGITYFLTLVDAYVDAHMFDFTVENNGLNNYMFNLRVNF